MVSMCCSVVTRIEIVRLAPKFETRCDEIPLPCGTVLEWHNPLILQRVRFYFVTRHFRATDPSGLLKPDQLESVLIPASRPLGFTQYPMSFLQAHGQLYHYHRDLLGILSLTEMFGNLLFLPDLWG